MENEEIRSIIRRFFRKTAVPRELLLKFQYWLLRPAARTMKTDALREIWEEANAEASSDTLGGLEAMGERIGSRQKTRRLPSGRLLPRAAAVLLLPLAGAGLTYLVLTKDFPAGGAREASRQLVEVVVPEGEIRKISLPDSSHVWLNSGSALLYAGDFSGKERRLFLSGEARFEVAKDKSRPFIVKTQYMEVRALGTIFNVNSYEGTKQTNVTLEEGLVRVDLREQEQSARLVHPDEQLIYDHRRRLLITRRVDAAQLGRWREGYLVFEEASLDEIIHAVENRFNITVEYDPRRYEDGSFSVKFSPGEGVEQIFNVLQQLIPGLKWEKEGENIVIY